MPDDELHDPEMPEGETSPFITPLTRRQFAAGGLTLGAAALLGLKGADDAEAAAAGETSFVPTEFFRERIHDVRPYPPKGTCAILLGAGGGPDSYFHHGCAAAVW